MKDIRRATRKQDSAEVKIRIVLLEREKIKRQTIEHRRLQHRKIAARYDHPDAPRPLLIQPAVCRKFSDDGQRGL